MTTLFANTGNMGLSLSLFAYGNSGLERSVIIFVLSMLLMFTVGPALLTGGGHFGQRLLDTWRWPPVWAAVGGVLLNVTHLQLPLFLERVLNLLGSGRRPADAAAAGHSGVPHLDLAPEQHQLAVGGTQNAALAAAGRLDRLVDRTAGT